MQADNGKEFKGVFLNLPRKYDIQIVTEHRDHHKKHSKIYCAPAELLFRCNLAT